MITLVGWKPGLAKQLSALVRESDLPFKWAQPPYRYTLRMAQYWIDSFELDRMLDIPQHYAVMLDGDTLVGAVKLGLTDLSNKTVAVSYWIGKPYRRKGYAKAAIQQLLDTYKEVTHRFEFYIYDGDTPSINTAKSVGAEFETVQRDRFVDKGKYRDGVLYVKLRE